MTNRKEMFFRPIRKFVLLFTQRERQRTYCGSVFELRAIVNNIFRYPELYDIKRAEGDDVRGACSRHQIFDVRANFEANLNCPNRKHHVFSVLYRWLCLNLLFFPPFDTFRNVYPRDEKVDVLRMNASDS